MPHLQAWDKHPKLKKLRAEYKVTAKHFARRVHQLRPDITVRFETLKPELTDDQLRQRYQHAKQMVQESVEALQSIVFLDEASISCKPTPSRVVAVRGQERLRKEPRLHPNKRDYGKVSWLLAVCGQIGLVDLQILSTTTGFKPDRQFHVSTWRGMTHLEGLLLAA